MPIRTSQLAGRFVLAAPLLFAQSTAAQLPDEVHVGTSVGVERVRLAVPAFLGDEAAGRVLRDVLRDDLTFSGLFNIPPAGLGAPYQLTGLAERDDEGVVVTVSLRQVEGGRVLMAKRLRGSDESLRRIAHRIADKIMQTFTGREGSFDSRIAHVAVRDGEHDVYVMDYDGANVGRVTNDGALALSPEVSPDGRLLVFTSYVEGLPAVYMVHRESGAVRRLFQKEGLNQSPAFSPDGQLMAFSASFEGNSEIYISAADGRRLRRVTSHPSIDVSPDWSPTGQELAFVSDRTGTPQVHVMTVDGLDVRRITFEGGHNADPAWSPDGTQIAFSSRRDGAFHVAVVDMTTGLVGVLTSGPVNHETPAWSPDGEFIAFASDRDGPYQIWVMRKDGTGMKPVTSRGKNRFPFWYR